MKTYQPKEKEIKRGWHLIDAKGEILGRLSTRIATLLMGKNKATYSTHMDSGDNVIVINVEKIIVTGRKAAQKVYQSASGFPAGFKEKKYKDVMKLHPERILETAIFGMLPDNKLKKERMKRLKLVVGDKNLYADKIKEN